MKAVDFEERTSLIAEDQEEYQTLPAHYNPDEGSLTFCMELDPDELKRVQETGRIWLKQLTFGKPMNPISLSVLKEDLISGEGSGPKET